MDTNELLLFDVEIEEESTEDSLSEKERRLVTQPFDFTVRSLVDQIEDGAISVDATWQRKYIWDNVKASRLIESLLLNVPIPVCYFAEEVSEQYLVIDGQQRLWSIYRYLKNQFPLKGLKTLGHLNRKRFFELNPKDQKFIRSRTLRCIALTQESHPDLRFDVFERLNTGSVSLTSQELRHCMYRGDLNVILEKLCNDPNWLRCLKRKNPDERLSDQELILRFFAFYFKLPAYKPPLYKFLNEFMRQHRKIKAEDIDIFISIFTNTINNVFSVFGENSFKRIIRDGEQLQIDKNINKSLFDLQMFVCSRLSPKECTEKSKEIIDSFRDLMFDTEFTDLITRSTDHRTRVIKRINLLLAQLLRHNIKIDIKL